MATATPRKQNAASRAARGPEKVDVQDFEGADAQRIGTLGSVLGGQQEIEVGAPEEVIPERIRQQMRTVVIRVNSDIEDMSWVGGGNRYSFTFEAGHSYRVPVQIAIELERIGKVYH
jgi:hypothetical protein